MRKYCLISKFFIDVRIGCSTTNLTLVIIGALFDLRRAPPPAAPPAAPAHWSTSIRSMAWSWQHRLPASDPLTAASGSTRARWKPDPQASPAADPEPPSQRAENRLGPLSTASLTQKQLIRVSLRDTPTFISQQLRFTSSSLRR